jgi:hypothetical protein
MFSFLYPQFRVLGRVLVLPKVNAAGAANALMFKTLLFGSPGL